MTTAHRLLFAALLTTIPTLALAQGKDMGQAGQYYRNEKFKFVPGPKKAAGGDVSWKVAPQGRVEVEKDEYALLENDVKVYYQDITLSADKVTLNLKTKDAVAEGHVIIDQGPTRLTATNAVFNLDSKTGTMFHATGSMEPSLYFTGDKLEKLGDRSYRLTDGVFTSCDIDRPAWSFHVRSADITLDDYAHLRDLTFRAHDLPVFWAPRLLWPTKKDRTAGMLIPRVNYSRTFGTKLELGYFQPLGESADVTGYAELNSKGYNGAGIDFRYLPTQNIKLGELRAYTVHDAEQNRQQWRYAYQHSQENLPGGFRGVVDVQDFSDLDFFRKYDNDTRLHTLSQVYSSAYLTKNAPTYSLNLLADRREILGGFSAPGQQISQSFEQLPSLQFRAYPQRIGATPLYLTMESSLSRLVTSSRGLASGPNADYVRGDIFPTLSLQLRTPAWFAVKPQISLRETYYSDSLIEPSATNPFPQQTTGESANRFYAQGQVEVIGPSFSRVFNRSIATFTRFKHVIEPRVRYVYTTDADNQDRVIRFDTVDQPLFGNLVEYSLTQRLIGKEAGPNGNSREVLSFSLRQTMSLDHDTHTGFGTTGSFFTSADQRFTPLVASLHVNPYQSITFDATATFGNVSHQLDQTSVSANLVGTGKNSDKYLSFTYFASLLQPGQLAGTDAAQVRINTGSSLLRDRIRADVQLNFDAKKGTFLEQRYLIGGNASCYGVAIEFRRYVVYEPQAKSIGNIGISVSLKNVGTIGTH